MLPTFVIGLREGLEAALIVGIIAAFLRKQGRRDLLRWVFLGVGVAVLLCVAVGVALDIVSRDLPQKRQEGLETVVGVLAVGMVTYMVVWMRQHSRELKGQLEGLAAEAIEEGGSRAGRAMVAMAFLAVLREGFETVVFLLAAFNETDNRGAAAGGASLGIVVAVALGYGIYRGGVRINLSKFFRATGLVLVLVAAGLVVSALHTAHEAGWLNLGQQRTVDLTQYPVIGWLLKGGSVQASLFTGMLGIQPYPVLIEVIGWLVYLVPVGCYVAWPPGRGLPRRLYGRVLLVVGAVCAVAALVLAMLAPGRPAHYPVTAAGPVTAQLSAPGHGASIATLHTQVPRPTAGRPASGPPATIALHRTGSATHDGLNVDVYAGSAPDPGSNDRPAALSRPRIAALNGGRLPLGIPSTGSDSFPVRYTDSNTVQVWVAPRTGRVVDLRWTEVVRVQVVAAGIGAIPLDAPLAQASAGFTAAQSATASSAARTANHTIDRRGTLVATAWGLAVLAAIALLAALAFSLGNRRREAITVREETSPKALIHG